MIATLILFNAHRAFRAFLCVGQNPVRGFGLVSAFFLPSCELLASDGGMGFFTTAKTENAATRTCDRGQTAGTRNRLVAARRRAPLDALVDLNVGAQEIPRVLDEIFWRRELLEHQIIHNLLSNIQSMISMQRLRQCFQYLFAAMRRARCGDANRSFSDLERQIWSPAVLISIPVRSQPNEIRDNNRFVPHSTSDRSPCQRLRLEDTIRSRSCSQSAIVTHNMTQVSVKGRRCAQSIHPETRTSWPSGYTTGVSANSTPASWRALTGSM